MHRTAAAGPEGGVFRGDGFAVEYGGGRSWSVGGGIDEVGVWKERGEVEPGMTQYRHFKLIIINDNL